MISEYKGRVLTIAGSDSSGGAGVQADIKTITMLGCYATSCITSITVQDTTKVYEVYDLPINIIREQILVVLDDIGVDAIKIGMLSGIEIIKAVTSVLPDDIPIIFDPVMVATTGFSLVRGDVVNVFKEHILPKSFIITPNIPEAQALTGVKIKNLEDMYFAATIILSYGSSAVLIKGGHLQGPIINNVLLTENYEMNFPHYRVTEDDFHGTGCTLSSGIASFIARGYGVKDSIEKSIDYVCKAIENSLKVGRGCRPIFHNYFLNKK